MRQMIADLLAVASPDEDIRRRGRLLVVLALSQIVLCLVALPLTILMMPSALALAALGIGAACYIVVLALARRGYVAAGGWLLMAVLILGTIGTLNSSDQPFGSAYFLALPLLVAGLVLRPAQVWLVLLVVLAGLALVLAVAPGAPLSDPRVVLTLVSALLLLGAVAYLGFLGGRATGAALAEASAARQAAEAAAAGLAEANASLEARVAERTAELQRALAEVEAQAREQARLLEENQQQREAIRDLSVPVLPVSDSTLVMPLIGALDSERLAQAQDQALHAIQDGNARYLVLDITGVPLVDSQVAQGVFAVVQAARLLGTEVVLVGIRPEVAQSLVGLGIELRGIRTFGDLRSALGVVTR